MPRKPPEPRPLIEVLTDDHDIPTWIEPAGTWTWDDTPQDVPIDPLGDNMLLAAIQTARERADRYNQLRAQVATSCQHYATLPGDHNTRFADHLAGILQANPPIGET